MNEIVTKIKDQKDNLLKIVIAFLVISVTGMFVMFGIGSNEQVVPQNTDYTTLTYTDSLGTNHYIEAEISASNEKRTEGLMFRSSLELGSGMLFIFSDSQPRTFWMKETYIPLDIIFFDENLKVVTIHQETKVNQTTELYSSVSPAKYALEVNSGWTEQVGIEVGDQIFLDKIFN